MLICTKKKPQPDGYGRPARACMLVSAAPYRRLFVRPGAKPTVPTHNTRCCGRQAAAELGALCGLLPPPCSCFCLRLCRRAALEYWAFLAGNSGYSTAGMPTVVPSPFPRLQFRAPSTAVLQRLCSHYVLRFVHRVLYVFSECASLILSSAAAVGCAELNTHLLNFAA